MANVGDRVFAIRNSTETEVFIYGFGVYNGNQKLPKEVGPEGMPNPQILLDNGGVVWGIQCWWGAEAAFEPRYGKHTKVEVSP
jgi:hypothetical protein